MVKTAMMKQETAMVLDSIPSWERRIFCPRKTPKAVEIMGRNRHRKAQRKTGGETTKQVQIVSLDLRCGELKVTRIGTWGIPYEPRAP